MAVAIGAPALSIPITSMASLTQIISAIGHMELVVLTPSVGTHGLPRVDRLQSGLEKRVQIVAQVRLAFYGMALLPGCCSHRSMAARAGSDQMYGMNLCCLMRAGLAHYISCTCE
jgi:hypothetical protein